MDLSSVIGIISGILVILGAYFFENGSVRLILEPVPIIIVVGGTFFATLLNFSFYTMKSAFKSASEIFINEKEYTLEIIEQIIELSLIARRDGILALEKVVDSIEDSFLKRGVLLVLDISNPQLLYEILNTEISLDEEQELINSRVFEALGGYSPTFGIVGAVLGLIQVMAHLQDLSKLGMGIATAFVSTLYGVGLANLIFLPIAGKLKIKLREKVILKELIVQGLMSIQMNENPTIIQEKLISYMSFTQKQHKIKNLEEESI